MTNPIDMSKITASSKFSGFKNNQNKSDSLSVASFTLGAFAFVAHTITIPIDNADSISSVQVKYTGLDDFWREVDGTAFRRYPSWSVQLYEISSQVYFSGSNLIIYTYIADLSGSSQTIPAFTIDVEAALFLAPF